MQLHKSRFAVLCFPSLRTFVVYADDEEDACELVKGYFAAHEPLAESNTFTASRAGSWDVVGYGPDGTEQWDVVGDTTAHVSVFEARKAPGA